MGPASQYSRRIHQGRTTVREPEVEGKPPRKLAGIPTNHCVRNYWCRHSLNDYLSKKTSFSTRSLNSDRVCRTCHIKHNYRYIRTTTICVWQHSPQSQIFAVPLSKAARVSLLSKYIQFLIKIITRSDLESMEYPRVPFCPFQLRTGVYYIVDTTKAYRTWSNHHHPLNDSTITHAWPQTLKSRLRQNGGFLLRVICVHSVYLFC